MSKLKEMIATGSHLLGKGKKAEALMQAPALTRAREGGGEGSRGGQVIGHTRSGKAIYATGNSAKDTKGWSKSDHLDAAALHDKVADHSLDATRVLADGERRYGPNPDRAKAMDNLANMGNRAANLAQAHRVAATKVGS